ncbi:hypothetical protein THRCLA_10184 [Thraustotheca clavata]|uniref:Tetratricopeptide repeat protein n=1 Tax=Thraustotheca clavata TaxID=74557 RepID=A0A1V9YSF1_9STRA|nr:hypothetical protein THRCLA_10184 [Thraustotheca clavata]
MPLKSIHETFWEGFQGALETTPSDAPNLLKDYIEVLLTSHQYVQGIPQIEAALTALSNESNAKHVLCCNSVAMQCLSQGMSQDALTLLTTADQLTISSSIAQFSDDTTRKRLRSITLNNFACYFKKHGKLHTAIQYLDRTLKLESSTKATDNPAGTHLNICAILSEMGRHVRAADHAKCAIQLLQYDNTVNPTIKSTDSLLAIAYYNYGVELEHLKKYDKASVAFSKGHAVASKELDANHPMLNALAKALADAQRHVERAKGYA